MGEEGAILIRQMPLEGTTSQIASMAIDFHLLSGTSTTSTTGTDSGGQWVRIRGQLGMGLVECRSRMMSY